MKTDPSKTGSKRNRFYRRNRDRQQAALDAQANKGSFRNRGRNNFRDLRIFRGRLASTTRDTFEIALLKREYTEDVFSDSDEETRSLTSPAPEQSKARHHNLEDSILNTRKETVFYSRFLPSLALWERRIPLDTPKDTPSSTLETFPLIATSSTLKYQISSLSVLKAARRESLNCTYLKTHPLTLGILNPVSPKKPGGASLSGGCTLEECLVRQSTLIDSLQSSDAGKAFYMEHRKTTDHSGLHDHAMLYSPGVSVIKDDCGRNIPPYLINVVSCVPVNAETVRAKFKLEETEREEGVRHVMRTRMARALRLFEEHGDKVLILGAFGVGQSCNSPEMIGSIWAELLCGQGSRFGGSFEKVVFIVPKKHRLTFKKAFDESKLEKDIEYVLSNES